MWFSRRSKLEGLDVELQSHLEMAIAERMSRGESEEEATRNAHAELGDFVRAREATSDTIGGAWAEQLIADLRHAARGLMRTPGFSIAAILTLVIGIGGAAAAFNIVRGVLIEPLPYKDPERLVSVWQDVQWPANRRVSQNPALYFTYRKLARSIEDIGVYQGVGTANIRNAGGGGGTGEGGEEPERVAASWMSASMFSTLRAVPVLGRVYTADEDRMHVPNVIVISSAVWRERFGGRRDVIGRTLIVNDIPREVIGVMPDNFNFPTSVTRLWIPMRLDAANPNTRGRAEDFGFNTVARLRKGVTPEAAERDFAAVLPRVAELYPEFGTDVSMRDWIAHARPSPVMVPLREDMTHDVATMLWLLAGAAAIVLIVASANVVNLLLIRADARRVQVAIRLALGANQLRILWHFLAEALTLATVAAALGIIGAAVAIRSLAMWGAATMPRVTELGIDGATVAFIGFIAIAAAFVFTIVPTIRTRSMPLFAVVRDGSITHTAGRAQHRFRSAIAGVQIALALVALNGAVLLLRTSIRLHSERPGFDASKVMTFWMQLPVARNPNDSSIAGFFSQLTDAVAEIPGVEAVGLTSRVPLGRGDATARGFYAEAGVSSQPLQESLQTYSVDSGYFAALRIPLVAGRPFDNLRRQRDREVIVSRAVAHDLWGDPTGNSALGKRLNLIAGGPAYTIIGVVDDVRDRSLAVSPLPTVYFPNVPTTDEPGSEHAKRMMALVVRSTGDGSQTAAVKRAVHQLNPTLPVFDVFRLSDVMSQSLARLRLIMLLLGSAAVVALALGMIGLYGIMDYVVRLRAREIGLRVALGADPRRIIRMMTQEGVVVASAGVGVGVAIFVLSSRSLRAFLYGVSTMDPGTLATSVVVLLGVACVASWFPARRASRIDPNIVLRAQ